MISDIKEIVPQNKFITPGYTQLTFTSGVNFTLDPNRLVILGPSGDEPFVKAQKYTESLGFIKCKAIGINFEYKISDFDFKNWFSKIPSKNGYRSKDVNLIKEVKENQTIVVTVSYLNDNEANIKFNHHFVLGEKMFQEVKFNFVSKKNIAIENNTNFKNQK